MPNQPPNRRRWLVEVWWHHRRTDQGEAFVAAFESEGVARNQARLHSATVAKHHEKGQVRLVPQVRNVTEVVDDRGRSRWVPEAWFTEYGGVETFVHYPTAPDEVKDEDGPVAAVSALHTTRKDDR